MRGKFACSADFLLECYCLGCVKADGGQHLSKLHCRADESLQARTITALGGMGMQAANVSPAPPAGRPGSSGTIRSMVTTGGVRRTASITKSVHSTASAATTVRSKAASVDNGVLAKDKLAQVCGFIYLSQGPNMLCNCLSVGQYMGSALQTRGNHK